MEHPNDPYDKAQLLLRFLRNEATPAEQKEVEDWLNADEQNRAFFHRLQSQQGLDLESNFFDPAAKQQAWQQLEQTIRPKTKTLWPRIAAAASVLIALSIGGYELFHKPAQQQIAKNQINDIAPGGNKAILTLANGQKISVTDAKNGIIAKQAGLQVKKTKNGDLVYMVNSQAASGSANSGTTEVAYNIISTPRGGQTHVTLADGTVAYLDAASSIKFPLAFNGRDREVTITGQVYFEVVHNAKQPFKVLAANETIEDIGTHFNVNAYGDEPAIKTTLIEGAIKVNQTLLKPGQEASLTGSRLSVTDADIDEVLSWKNGYFQFDSESIQPIMRKIARWYDVDVIYQGNPPTDKFWGTVSRFGNVSEVLNKLALTDKVHFKIEGRRIMVSN